MSNIFPPEDSRFMYKYDWAYYWFTEGKLEGLNSKRDFIELLCEVVFPYVSPSDDSWIYPTMIAIIDPAFKVDGRSGYYDVVRENVFSEDQVLIIHALINAIPCIDWGTAIRGFWVDHEYQEAFQKAWENLDD